MMRETFGIRRFTMKNIYKSPVIDFISFDIKDIITASIEPEIGFGAEDDVFSL